MSIDPLFSPVPRLLEVAHVAHRLGFSQEYVRDLIKLGRLPAIRIGRRWRVDPVDLEAFVDGQRVGPTRATARPRLHLQPAADGA